MTRWAGTVALAIALVGVVGPALPARAQEPATVQILYDLGDGAFYWSSVTTPDRFAVNATWDATRTGAGMHGLGIEHSWHPVWGIAVHDIGQRDAPSGYVGLFLWNATSAAWEPATVGVSALVLGDGDAIAWANAAYDPNDFTVLREPVASPLWPYPATQFRTDGISGSGFGSERAGTGTSGSEAPNSANLLWERDLGVREIVSTPAVAYGRLYVLTMEGLFALDDVTGEIVWSNPAVHGLSSPAVVDGSVIVGSSDGRVYAVNAFDGAEVWNTTLLTQTLFSGISSSPRIAMDWAFVGTFNESGGPGELVALWSSNGTVAWRHPTGSVHFSSPTVLRSAVCAGIMGFYNTTTQITFDPPYGLLSLYRDNGTERWFFPTAAPVAASPVVSGSLAFVASQDGNMYSVWLGNGTERWRARVGPSISSAAYVGDAQFSAIPPTLFVGSGGFGGTGNVTALDALDGSVLWTFAPNGPVQSSLAYADGKVFFATNTPEGTVYALNATTGRLIWSHRPAPADHILSSPAVSNGTLYFAHDNGRVYAYRDSRDVSSASVSVLDFSYGAPLFVGREVNVEVEVRAERGAITNAVLRVFRTSHLEFASASPAPTEEPWTWALGDLGFEEVRTISLRVRGVSTDPANVVASIHAQLEYSDAEGVPRPIESDTLRLSVYNDSVPWWAVAVGAFAVAAIVAAAALIAFILSRRQRRESP